MQRSSCCLKILIMFLILVPSTTQLQSSQAWSLLRIQRLLNYPSFLSLWNNSTDFCSSDPNPFVTIVCYEDSITQLHIAGNSTSTSLPLPRRFSIESFFTTLTRLPNLKVLSLTNLGLWGVLPGKISRLSSLEIVNVSSNYLYGALPEAMSQLSSLQTLILDHNMFGGRIPGWWSGLPLLAVVSLKNNTFDGALPDSIKSLESLRILDLSSNRLSGPVPDLSGLTNLQVLDLGGNYFGPQFPSLGKKVVTLVLRKNRFTDGLPSDLSSYSLLEKLDVSSNRFVGPFMPALLSLPSIRYLDISSNRFTGMLFQNMSCNGELEYVDLSSNLMSGDLPTCLVSDSKERVALYSANCFESNDLSQHPVSYCQNQALAVGILPHKQKRAALHKTAIVLTVAAALLLASLLLGFFLFFFSRRSNTRKAMKKPPRRLVEHASNGYPSKLLADARYISQTIKLGALGVPAYRSFSPEEIEAATNNFDSSAFMGESSHGQLYRGRLKDGSLVAIRCLKLKKSHSSQNFNRHVELISKLRYRHLVSSLGHCFEYYFDDSTVSRLFLVFEYVSDGTLRSYISEGERQKLTWTQRIAAAIGVARGIQFLHAGMVPGFFANDLKITNVLLDQNLVAKISSYNLPVLAENMKNEVVGSSSSSNRSKLLNERVKHGDKIDMYDFGVILLEVISGRPVTSHNDVESVKYQLQASTTADGIARKTNAVDPVVRRTCCNESLKTVVEMCFQCLSKEPADRPSVEDVLWNLQFAAQVQDAWRGESHSSEGSSMAPSPIN